MFDSDPDDRDEEEFTPIGPTGTEFSNPLVSGSGFLFGSGGGGSGGGQAEPTGLFGEPARESDPVAGGGPFGGFGGFGGTTEGRDQGGEPTGLFGEPTRDSDPAAGGGPFGSLGGFGGTGGGRTGDEEDTAGFGLFFG